MSELFSRSLYVELADKDGIGEKFIARTMSNVDKNGNENKDGYDISFSVNKNQKKDPNESTLTIYGLEEETINKLEEDFVYVTLYGGYGKDIKLISLGNISKLKVSYNEATTVVVISYQDGARQYRESRVNKTYPAGTSYYSIIKDLASTMNYADPKVLDIDTTKTISNSKTLSGSSAKYLREYCDKMGLSFSVQNNKMIIKKDDSGIDDINFAFVINEDSGLVGSVDKNTVKLHKKYVSKRKQLKKPSAKSVAARNKSIAEAQSKFTSKQFDKEHSLDFKVLLTPEIIPGSYLVIESKFNKPTYGIVKELTHSGSNFSDEWHTDIKSIVI